MSNAAPAPAVKPSALAALKALGKKPEPGTSTIIPAAVRSMTDPAIVGAKRDRNTVKLGYDPAFARKARYCAHLHTALERAQADFAIFQGETRDYGLQKRGAYNDAYKTCVTTVCVPYPEHVIEDGATGTFQPAPGSEMRWVQVICTSRYSVQAETVLANRDRIGPDFDRLFKVEETSVLKPNAEELFRNLLIELGAAEDETHAGQMMAQLFEKKTKVSTTEGFEGEFARLPAPVRDLLRQMVTRAAPGLKFPE